MEEPKGHVCPECGAPRGADNSPSCACAQRLADALRDTRAAEAAAAEDFDPLRIRPYVDCGGRRGQGDERGHGGHPGDAGVAGAAGDLRDGGDGVDSHDRGAPGDARDRGDRGDVAGTEPGTFAKTRTKTEAVAKTRTKTKTEAVANTATEAEAETETEPGIAARTDTEPEPAPAARTETEPRPATAAQSETGAEAEPGNDSTMALRPVRLPTPPAPQPGAPSASDLSLFEAGGEGTGAGKQSGGGTERLGPEPDAGPHSGPDTEAARRGRGRRRPAALLAVSAAVVAVVAAAGYAGGLFSYASPTRDEAAAREVRASIPDAPTPAVSAPSASAPVAPASSAAVPPVTQSPSPTASATPSPSASASASVSQAPPSPSGSSTGTAAAGPPQATGTLRAGETQTPGSGPVLRIGDRGSEVRELQLRLGRLHLYTGRADGVFDRRVEDSVRVYQWARGTTSDGLGVYGPATRRSLESETSRP